MPIAHSTQRKPVPDSLLQRDPERTRQRILDAALAEFSAKGLSGARIDEIAQRAGINKRMLYHYFGNKEDLYLAALETVYESIRESERQLRLEDLPPDEAMRELVRFTWQYFLDHPEFMSLLNNENLHEGRHISRSTRILELHPPLVALIDDVLRRGVAAGVFRGGVDPVQLYITIASLGYFYLSNRHTLSTIFARDLGAAQELAARREHIVDVTLGYLRRENESLDSRFDGVVTNRIVTRSRTSRDGTGSNPRSSSARAKEAVMTPIRLGIIMHGVTGRMGMNQHLIRSIKAIQAQAGVELEDGRRVMPDPILVGRNAGKLEALADEHGIERWTVDLEAALGNPEDTVFFDAAATKMRADLLRRAIAAGKHVYCEKPIAETLEDALDVARLAKRAGVKNGVVQDKLFLPGLLKLKLLRDAGFFGRILSVRGEFGYWVFEGDWQPAQRPSWNYRKAEGGGMILDMLPHWRYVLDNLFGEVTAVSSLAATHIPERVDERGRSYAADADDAAYATFELEGGVIAQINSSWAVRVRRDDLVTFQVDGTHGSAVAGLTRCFTQHRVNTPKPVWNPDQKQTIDFLAQWEEVPDNQDYDNAFKVQWEALIRHVVADAPFPWTLADGAKGVQLAELGLKSWAERRWVDVPKLEI